MSIKEDMLHRINWRFPMIRIEMINRIAYRIYALRKHQGVTVDMLSSIVKKEAGGRFGLVQCCPSQVIDNSCRLAIFISLTSPTYVAGQGHLNIRQILGNCVQLMQGSHEGILSVLIITDNWDAEAWAEMQPDIEKTKKHVNALEAYLLVNRRITQIPLR